MMRELIALSVIDPTLTGKKMRLASRSKIKDGIFFFLHQTSTSIVETLATLDRQKKRNTNEVGTASTLVKAVKPQTLAVKVFLSCIDHVTMSSSRGYWRRRRRPIDRAMPGFCGKTGSIADIGKTYTFYLFFALASFFLAKYLRWEVWLVLLMSYSWPRCSFWEATEQERLGLSQATSCGALGTWVT